MCGGVKRVYSALIVKFSLLPDHQLPRERLAAVGVESLSVQELLALQLRSGVAGGSAVDLAESVLAEFGDLERIAGASADELMRVAGIGEAKAAAVVAAFELGRRARCQDVEAVYVRRASDAAEIVAPQIAHLRRERVVVLVCDRNGTLLHTARLSEGTASRALIDVREVLNTVLRHDGAAFALAHNHPSGDPSPSDADIEVTEVVARGAKTVGLRFLGHVIVAGAEWKQVG